MLEEILFNILLWLPVVSLLRFKRVCKSWLALIESPRFINEHLQHHSGEDAFIVSYSKPRKLGFCLFSGNRYEINTDIDFNNLFYTTIRADNDIVQLVDSCHGIICLHNDWSGDVALWNPALKQLKLLPKSSLPDPRHNPGNTVAQFVSIGFGFDAKANDYKVVRIIRQRSAGLEVNQVEVYNLRTSSSWRIIHKNVTLPFNYFVGHSFDHATSKNGTCFWLGVDNHGSILVAFDLKNEVFETMSLPESHESEPCGYALDFLNEKLAYIRGMTPFWRGNDCFEIWLLHEFGIKETWQKIYNIGPIPSAGACELFPIGFSMNGKFLLLRTTFGPRGMDELYLYNFCTGEATQESYTPIQLVPNRNVQSFVLHYNESLVSLKNVGDGGD